MYPIHFLPNAILVTTISARDRNKATRVALLNKILELEGEKGESMMWNENGSDDPMSDTWFGA